MIETPVNFDNAATGPASPLHGLGWTMLGAVARGGWPVAVGLAGFLVIGLIWRLHGGSGFHARIERKRFMTAAEVRFWGVLQSALPEYRIFGQVAMGALLKPVAGLSRKQWWSTYGRFSQKIVDFVVVNPRSGDVLAVIELDDRSHDSRKDAARDALLARGGYPVHRFLSRHDIVEVRRRFEAVLEDDYVRARLPAAVR